jgi:DmsE family decaheme c-type cytochrome
MKGTSSLGRTRGTLRWLAVTVSLSGLACLVAPRFAAADAEPAPAAATSPAADPMADATYVGEKVCLQCHQVENKHFGHTTHARAFRLNPKSEAEKQVCEACHGPGSKHAPKENNSKHEFVIGFTKEWGTPVEAQNAQCLTCHSGEQRIDWPGSTHDLNKLACSDCHNPMARFSATGLLKKTSISETCETCHQQQRAEFNKRSHMPLPEGKIACEDCHNPHGSPTKPLLKAVSVNELCYSCHAEKRGPLIWEHAPVRENCLNCHLPHGSNNDKLLVVSRPFLCFNCHNSVTGHPSGIRSKAQLAQFLTIDPATGLPANGAGAAFDERTASHSCNNCHSQIHGSNHPSGEYFQR